MENKLSFYLHDILKNDVGASLATIQNLEKELGFELPVGYVDFVTEFDGGEGEVGENSWLCLFPVEELSSINKDYHLLMDEIPDYFLFGKDSADTGFAFHKKMKTFHSFGLMSNFETDNIELCGETFADFIEHLYDQ